jgi:hypothetical protein
VEIKLDIGKHVYNDLAKFAKDENKDIDVFAGEILDFGLRVYKAQQGESEQEIDEHERLIIENNKVVKEIIRCVFVKSKTRAKAFDADTLLTMVENETDAYFRGKLKK